MPEYIEITIDEDGQIESEVHGVLGPDCERLVDWLDELGHVAETRRTPDYHRQQQRGRRQRISL